MTIEMSPKASPVKPAEHSATGKARGAGGAQEEGAENGFSALLAAADGGEKTDSSSTAPSEQDDTLLQADLPPGATPDTPVVDASALLAQALALNPAQPEGGAARVAGKHPLAAVGSGLGDASGEGQPINPFSAHKPGKGGGDQALKQEAVESTLSASTHANTKSVAQEFKETSPQDMFKALQTAVEALPVAATTTREKALAEPVGAKSVSASDSPSVGFASSSGPLGADGVVSTQAAATVESFVAEQVTYWIGQDVQKAELKLDGLGVDPVEVSISMQGNEAHVSFRTDELQARDALEHASTHLKELLGRQGVVLSGVSVGTSQSGDASTGQGRQPRPDGRRGMVSTLEPVAVEANRPSRVANGRTLDLFV
ncbi:flagellar hook-length control protein FliK [Rhodoferax saidenbachensis]|uniref:Flagellar hook-length control protein FliK n=1 Tax=Rhodoferax saidenbachensis TaxID=1484693 RepID=A0ABU1ZU09_9BURK|nr:flagellar hook-length control protein FliK [Rhodoferax saidenbachensis]MDR7308898.1 flagellar hook-length control protein FliK [Rhodoferax saidenbachensis]